MEAIGRVDDEVEAMGLNPPHSEATVPWCLRELEVIPHIRHFEGAHRACSIWDHPYVDEVPSDAEIVAGLMTELHSSLTRAKWAQAKLANGIDSHRVRMLRDAIITALQLSGEIRAKDTTFIQVPPR